MNRISLKIMAWFGYYYHKPTDTFVGISLKRSSKVGER